MRPDAQTKKAVRASVGGKARPAVTVPPIPGGGKPVLPIPRRIGSGLYSYPTTPRVIRPAKVIRPGAPPAVG